MQAPLCQSSMHCPCIHDFPASLIPLHPASEEHLEVFLLLVGSSKSAVSALVFVVLLALLRA